MYLFPRLRTLAAAGLAVAFLAVFLYWTGTARAQRFVTDPVDGLRRVLRAQLRDLAVRKREITKRVAAIQTMGQLSRALALQEWRDEDADPEVAGVDFPAREEIAKRFAAGVQELVRQGDPTAQLAVANMIGEIGVTTRGIRTKSGFARQFAPELVELINKGTPPVREAAARALGLINPDPAVAVPALARLLGAEAEALRIAAADGLSNMVHVEAQLASRTQSATGVQATRAELIQVDQMVVSVATKGLADASAAARRRCAAAIREAAASLNRQVDVRSPEDIQLDTGTYRKQMEEERTELMPLVNALRDAAPPLGRALRDVDPAIRLLAADALEDMSTARLNFLRRIGVRLPGDGRNDEGAAKRTPFTVASQQKTLADLPEDPLLKSLLTTLPDLQAALSEKEARVRLAVLDVLETLGPAAASAAPAVVRALTDCNMFVRWAAARTLGKMGPVELATTVAGLVHLLEDPDLDVNLAAATALTLYGPAASAAVPGLIAHLQATDAEKRLAIIHTLEAIGAAARPAIPAFAAELRDPDSRVRQAAAEALALFGPAAREAEGALRQALSDTNADVRKAVSDALLSILRSEAR